MVECKVLIIDHDGVLSTLCTFFMDKFLTITMVWGHTITLPSDTVYHVTLQESCYTVFMHKNLLNLVEL